MKKLTIENLKKIGSRYSKMSLLIRNINPSGYNNGITQGEQHALLIQSIITFSSEKQLKYFLQNELLKLTKDNLKETFAWKQPDIKNSLIPSLTLLFYDVNIDLSDLEIQFLILYIYRLYQISNRTLAESSFYDFIKNLPNYTYSTKEILQLDRIKNALESIDYLDYIDQHELKKALMEVQLGI